MSSPSRSIGGSLKVVPVGAPVEVYDEEDRQWYRGGSVADFNEETQLYTILWGNDETTTTDPTFVRRVVDWKRVKHPAAFNTNTKKAPYQEWLSQQPAYVPPPPPEPADDDEASQEVAEPWVNPSKKTTTFQEWKSEGTQPVKKRPLWEKRLSRYEKNQQKKMEERPAFGVQRKAQWETWKTTRADLPPKKENVTIQKYWGRFAPDSAFSDDDDDVRQYQPQTYVKQEQTPAPAQEKKKKKKKATAKKEHQDPMVDEAHEQEPEQEPEPESVQEEEVVEEPAQEEVEAEEIAPEVLVVPAEEEKVPEPEKEKEKEEPPAASSPISTTPPPAEPRSPTNGKEESKEPASNIPISLAEDQTEARATLFAQLRDEDSEDGDSIPVSNLSKVLPLLSLTDIYETGVKPSLSSAKSVSQSEDAENVTRAEFRVFLISLNRYIALHDLYGNVDSDKTIEPAEFERAIPLLSKWGADMADVAEAFGSGDSSESQITFCDFLTWAIKQGITECTEN